MPEIEEMLGLPERNDYGPGIQKLHYDEKARDLTPNGLPDTLKEFFTVPEGIPKYTPTYSNGDIKLSQDAQKAVNSPSFDIYEQDGRVTLELIAKTEKHQIKVSHDQSCNEIIVSQVVPLGMGVRGIKVLTSSQNMNKFGTIKTIAAKLEGKVLTITCTTDKINKGLVEIPIQ